MMQLQISKWGNSLAVRIPADTARQMGAKEGDPLQVHLGADGGLNLRVSTWSRAGFAQELEQSRQALPLGTSVMEQLGEEARY